MRLVNTTLAVFGFLLLAWVVPLMAKAGAAIIDRRKKRKRHEQSELTKFVDEWVRLFNHVNNERRRGKENEEKRRKARRGGEETRRREEKGYYREMESDRNSGYDGTTFMNAV